MKRAFLHILPLLLIAIICLLVYANTFEVSFQYDDRTGIVENHYLHLRELSPANLVTALTKGRYSNRPVSQLSFALNYYLGGLDVSGYHLVNILIHTLTGIILYFLLVITLDLGPLKGKYEKREQLALFIVLLWAVHPIQTQSVTYILQRMTSMAGMFFLLSLYLYVRGRLGETRRLKVWCYSGSAAAGVLALGSKEIAGVLPLMLALYEFYFFQNLDFRVIRQNWVFIIGILVIFITIAIVYLGPNIIEGVLAFYQNKDFTLGERLLTQLRVVMHYLSLLVFPLPSRLNLDYDFPVSQSLFNPLSTFLCLLGLIGLVVMGVYLARRKPLASFGIFWFLGNLVVESSVVGLMMVFEHRLYLPLLGFLLFLVEIARRKVIGKKFIYGAFIVILIFAFWTIQRNIVWKNEFTLWSDCREKSPDKAGPHNNLGTAYFERGMYEEAIREYQQALAIDPDFAEAFYNLGSVYSDQGMYDEAIREYQQALEIKPDFAEAYNNLGIAYRNKGMYAEAIRKYQQVLAIDPDFAEAFYNLGSAYANQGMYAEAIREYEKAIEIEPDYAKAFYDLGNTYAIKGMLAEAIREYKKAIKIKPDYAEVYFKLGVIYYHQKQYDLSVRYIEKAEKLGYLIPLEFREILQNASKGLKE